MVSIPTPDDVDVNSVSYFPRKNVKILVKYVVSYFARVFKLFEKSVKINTKIIA